MTRTRNLVLAALAFTFAPLGRDCRAAEPSPETATAPAPQVADCPLHAAHLAAGAGTSHGADPDAALRARGDEHMGFPQAATTHHFRLAADGGAIEVTANDPADEVTIARVREHLRHIAAAFAAGDFSIPQAVHAAMPPGAREMAAAGRAIEYGFGELPAGGRVRLVARGEAALAAVHEFLRFQIADHATGDPAAVPHH